MDIKDKIKTIFKKSLLFNIIGDESNNIKGKQIFNMIVLTKNYYIFYIFSKLVFNKYFDVAKDVY